MLIIAGNTCCSIRHTDLRFVMIHFLQASKERGGGVLFFSTVYCTDEIGLGKNKPSYHGHIVVRWSQDFKLVLLLRTNLLKILMTQPIGMTRVFMSTDIAQSELGSRTVRLSLFYRI